MMKIIYLCIAASQNTKELCSSIILKKEIIKL